MASKPAPRLPRDMLVQSIYRERLKEKLKDPARLNAVYGSNFWRHPDTPQLQQFLRISKDFLNADEAHITLIGYDFQRIVASTEVDPKEDPLDWSICQYLLAVDGPLPIDNALETLQICDVKAVAEGKLRSYLGVPLVARSNQIIGGLCVVQYKPREWTDLEVMLMTRFAGSLMNLYEASSEETVR